MNKPLIQFKNFSFQYESQQEPTLKNINLTIQRGEKVLIAGPSGAGKSTIGKCLNGLIPNTNPGKITGQCVVNGKDISHTDLFALSFTTSTILQDSDAQFVGLTVGEDIAFALENDCTPQKKMHAEVAKWAKEMDLAHLLRQPPQSLSGGQKQRVALAGVLVDHSPILLFDEPLANLDPASGYATMKLIDQIQKKLNATVIIIEHRLEEVLTQNIDRIILVNDGKIIADEAPDPLLHTHLLAKSGIRTPLYIDALRNAGIDLTSLDLRHVNTLKTSPAITKKLQTWSDHFQARKRKIHRQPLLVFQKVGYSYQPEQLNPLRDFNAVINQGDFISLVGQNGAGKTTLCRVICGFVKGKGKCLFRGQDLAALSIKERADKIGYVMQDPNAMISQTMIFDEVALGLRLRNWPEREIKEKVNQTLKICGLYPFRHWPIAALSFGQKKRVTIAAILVLEPDLLILDEPTAGQDWRTYTEIMNFIKHLNQRGKTIMIVTHDMHLMTEYTNRSFVLSKGKLLADTTPIKLLTNPALVKAAHLRQTSLFDLAQHYHLKNKVQFVENCVACEQKETKENAYE